MTTKKNRLIMNAFKEGDEITYFIGCFLISGLKERASKAYIV